WIKQVETTARARRTVARDASARRRRTSRAASASPSHKDSPLDPEVFGQLREADRAGGNRFLAALIGKFMQEAPARLATLRDAVGRADAEVVVKAAHALKGSAGVLGAAAMAAACKDVEELGRSGSVAGAETHVAR